MDTAIFEKALRQVIGLNVSSIGRASLHRAIRRRMECLQIASQDSYQTYFNSTQNEIIELIEEVTVSETWFFRDKNPFQALSSFVKRWFSLNPNKKIRILSIPCATGEEPYSISITLQENAIHPALYSIDAVDINSKAIELAEKGIYNSYSFRDFDQEEIKNRYFKRINNNYQIRADVRDTVSFHCANLLDLPQDGIYQKNNYDIIFCRNLLIYLNSSSQKQAITTLGHLLADNGILFTGHAELGIFSDSEFTTSSFNNTFSLIKKNSVTNAGHAYFPMAVKKAEQNLEDIPRLEGESIVSNKKSIDINKIHEAQLYLGKRQYDKAITLCKDYVEKHGPLAAPFFILGEIYYKMGRSSDAVNILKKTIYLDPEHLSAMKLLETIYLDSNNSDAAVAIRERIKRVTKRLRNM